MKLPPYSRLLWPDRVKCCGVWLRPFTLGHALVLERMESPLAYRWPAEAGPPPFDEVLFAAWVCSRDWRDAVRLLDTRRCRWWMKIRSLLRWKKDGHDAGRFVRYLTDAWPDVNWWNLRGVSTAERGTALLQLLVAGERKIFGLPLEAALDVQVAVALADYLSNLEAEGVIRIYSETDDGIQKMMDRIAAGTAPGQPGFRGN
jgi:hypothetical protein